MLSKHWLAILGAESARIHLRYVEGGTKPADQALNLLPWLIDNLSIEYDFGRYVAASKFEVSAYAADRVILPACLHECFDQGI